MQSRDYGIFETRPPSPAGHLVGHAIGVRQEIGHAPATVRGSRKRHEPAFLAFQAWTERWNFEDRSCRNRVSNKARNNQVKKPPSSPNPSTCRVKRSLASQQHESSSHCLRTKTQARGSSILDRGAGAGKEKVAKQKESVQKERRKKDTKKEGLAATRSSLPRSVHSRNPT